MITPSTGLLSEGLECRLGVCTARKDSSGHIIPVNGRIVPVRSRSPLTVPLPTKTLGRRIRSTDSTRRFHLLDGNKEVARRRHLRFDLGEE